MPIYAVGGYIETFAPEKCEAVAIFTLDGFSGTNLLFREFTNNRQKTLLSQDQEFYTNQDKPWNNRMDTFWKITPPKGITRYYYVFSNPRGRKLDNIDRINQYIKTSLDYARLEEIKSIAYLIFDSDKFNLSLIARRMIEVIKEWEEIEKYEIDIYLVDRVNGFQNILASSF
jgi:hypothetical protein